MSSLLMRVGQGKDKQAFAELFEYFAPRVKAYMFKLGSDDAMAEELAQKTMLQIWRKADLFDDMKAAASTWIFRVARNLRIDELRKETRFEYDQHDFTLIADKADSPERTLDRSQHADIMRRAIECLSSEQTEVIELSFYQGLSHGKIASHLDIPLGTVKSRMRLAFAKLKSELGNA